jgi:hypothetical protein
MGSQSALVMFFIAGAAIQIYLLSRRPFPWGAAGISLLCALLAFKPFRNEEVYEPLRHLLYAVGMFGAVFALSAARDFLPVLRERAVWAMNLVFWFVFLQSHDLALAPHRILALVLLVPSALSLAWCWSYRPMGHVGQIACYLWFMLLLVLLGFWGFQFSPFALFGEEREVPWITPLEGFLGGMTFMLLLIYGTYLAYLVPLPGRNQSFKERMKDWREFVALLEARFHNVHSDRIELVTLTAVICGVFLAHYWVEWMTEGLAIGLTAGLISVWSWPSKARDESGIPLEQTIEKRLQELAEGICNRLLSGMQPHQQTIAQTPEGTLTVDVLEGAVSHSSGLSLPPSVAAEVARWFRHGCEAHRIDLSRVNGVQVVAKFTTTLVPSGREHGVAIDWKCHSRIETGLTTFQAQSAKVTFVKPTALSDD